MSVLSGNEVHGLSVAMTTRDIYIPLRYSVIIRLLSTVVTAFESWVVFT